MPSWRFSETDHVNKFDRIYQCDQPGLSAWFGPCEGCEGRKGNRVRQDQEKLIYEFFFWKYTFEKYSETNCEKTAEIYAVPIAVPPM